MDERDLRKAGQSFCVGEDLYGISVEQLKGRIDILKAELIRIDTEIAKKTKELTMAENFFKKP